MKKTLLFGAGFSADLGMPLASELSEDFFGYFPEQSIDQLAELQQLGRQQNSQPSVFKMKFMALGCEASE